MPLHFSYLKIYEPVTKPKSAEIQNHILIIWNRIFLHRSNFHIFLGFFYLYYFRKQQSKSSTILRKTALDSQARCKAIPAMLQELERFSPICPSTAEDSTCRTAELPDCCNKPSNCQTESITAILPRPTD